MPFQSKAKILIVDDIPANLVALRSILDSEDYEIIEADSGTKALTILSKNEVALVLLDVMMPERDGYETAREIKERFASRDIAIIFVTAMALDDAYIRQGYAIGAVDFISKPIDSEILKTKVHLHSDRYLKTCELRASVQRAQSILDTAYDAFISIDDQGLITDWNNRAEATFGWSKQEVVGKPLTDTVIPPRFRERHLKGLNHFLATGEGPVLGKPIEMPALQKSGFEIPIELTISAIKLSDGYAFNAFLRDISDRKKAENIQDIQLKVTRIVTEAETIPEVFSASLKAICKGLNWDFGAMWIPNSEKDALVLAEAWHQDHPCLNEFHRTCSEFSFSLGSGLPGRVWKTGEPTWIEDATSDANFPRAPSALKADLHGALAFPVFADSEFIGVIEFLSHKRLSPDARLLEMMSDLGTRLGFFMLRKKAQDELRQSENQIRKMRDELAIQVEEKTKELAKSRDKAESANIAKSNFLANMSHEIRTPLGAVIGFSELLLNPEIAQSDKASFVETIKRNGELLSNIINDILDLSRVEAGKLEVENRETAIGEVLTDLSTVLSLRAAEKGIKLTITYERNVPKIIRTDPLRLRQVLFNIVGNAIKFTERGSVDVTLKLVPKKEGAAQLAFVVKDTGKGISQEQAEGLFKPFSQADTTSKRKFGGAGLGLALSRHLANVLGGDLALTQSTINKGSEFTITIDPGPIRESLGYEVEQKRVDLTSQSIPIRLEGVRVLLAEDSPDNQILVSKVLHMAGAEVDIADNGKEALKKAQHQKYDVLLMDLQMPIMDGYETTKNLRNEGYDTPIIALTAHALKEERDYCLTHGFNDHVSKPINRKTLLESIANFSTKRNSQR